MAQVRFVFDTGTDLVVNAASDRGAKLMVTGVRRRMEDGETLIEVKGTSGIQFVNPMRLSYIQVIAKGGSGSKKSNAAIKARMAKARAARSSGKKTKKRK